MVFELLLAFVFFEQRIIEFTGEQHSVIFVAGLLIRVALNGNPSVLVRRMHIPQALEACGKLLLDTLFFSTAIERAPDLHPLFALQRIHLAGDCVCPRSAGELPRPPPANDKPISHAAAPTTLTAKSFLL